MPLYLCRVVSDTVLTTEQMQQYSTEGIHFRKAKLNVISCIQLFVIFRVEPPEAAHVWQCFHDVLHTKKCQQLTSQGQPLILKSIIFQVCTYTLFSNLPFS